MCKAYDRVQWNFLYKILKKFGFPDHFIRLISRCIENCYFSVLVNGEISGFFNSKCGLRQGDPISPSLFIIAAEFLSRRLDSLFQDNRSMFYQCRGRARVSHLAYADDIIIFTNNKQGSITSILQTIEYYEKVSGQLINASKSCVVVSKRCS